MIHLKFEGGSSGPDIILGPAPWFRIASNFISPGPDGSLVGSFRNHYWEVQGRRLARYFCDEPHTVNFEDRYGGCGAKLGPFSYLRVEDGALHADNVLRAKFLDYAQLWHCYDASNYWPVLMIEAA